MLLQLTPWRRAAVVDVGRVVSNWFQLRQFIRALADTSAGIRQSMVYSCIHDVEEAAHNGTAGRTIRRKEDTASRDVSPCSSVIVISSSANSY